MGFVEVGGIQAHYLAPRGLPVRGGGELHLLVHGAGGSLRHFEPLLAHWPPQGSPVAVDLPGHGLSEGVALTSPEAAVSFLGDFLAALGCAGPVSYVGHSLGGLIGLLFALRHAKRVQRLTLMATAPKLRLHPDFMAQARTGRWDLESLRGSFAPTVSEAVKETVLEDFLRLRLSPGIATFEAFLQADLRSLLPDIAAPTLVLTGDDDVIVSRRHSQLLAREIRGASLTTIHGAGHYLHLERPEVVAGELDRFLPRAAARGAHV